MIIDSKEASFSYSCMECAIHCLGEEARDFVHSLESMNIDDRQKIVVTKVFMVLHGIGMKKGVISSKKSCAEYCELVDVW